MMIKDDPDMRSLSLRVGCRMSQRRETGIADSCIAYCLITPQKLTAGSQKRDAPFERGDLFELHHSLLFFVRG